MNQYAQIELQADPFRSVILQLNAVLPLLCVVGLLAGGLLLAAKNRWGYYIIGVSVVGLIVRMFIAD